MFWMIIYVIGLFLSILLMVYSDLGAGEDLWSCFKAFLLVTLWPVIAVCVIVIIVLSFIALGILTVYANVNSRLANRGHK